ncbi:MULTISPECIES: 5-(carboxyamino)imidazole ribonucleotide mutase [unclassified Prochlorococcus]|uniref:5-(carboxyamino)imidazole ribonucleotide mutase n=1 Tax=unclassified Prochlorococcus TaxID=2627481 RepID=UPI00055F4686|nr:MULTISPECIES: 5-(carboxyamino)imidazole ribonucleotide mutase [unclassified Prochlorococcus]
MIVAVVMGSDSDLPSLEPAIKLLEGFSLKVETRILSAHRTPIRMVDFANQAEDKGLKVIIAGAGGAAHLPGMIASITSLPVIGVPIESKALKGIDSLYSIVQMPAGIPVATVAINGGLNAGLLAAQILSTSIPSLKSKILKYRDDLRNNVIKKDNKLNSLGASTYLTQM